jgi:hypothetical protein
MANLNMDKLKVSKIDAARRQLDCAIELWFLEKDDVSIHTLAAASYQIIHDISQKRKIGRDLLYDTDIIKDEYRADFVRLVKQPQNFFKHADKDPDPDGQIEFMPFSSFMFMLVSLTGLKALGYPDSENVHILTTWISIYEPRYLTADYRKVFENHIPVKDRRAMEGHTKQEFFHVAVQARANLRAKGLL